MPTTKTKNRKKKKNTKQEKKQAKEAVLETITTHLQDDEITCSISFDRHSPASMKPTMYDLAILMIQTRTSVEKLRSDYMRRERMDEKSVAGLLNAIPNVFTRGSAIHRILQYRILLDRILPHKQLTPALLDDARINRFYMAESEDRRTMVVRDMQSVYVEQPGEDGWITLAPHQNYKELFGMVENIVKAYCREVAEMPSHIVDSEELPYSDYECISCVWGSMNYIVSIGPKHPKFRSPFSGIKKQRTE